MATTTKYLISVTNGKGNWYWNGILADWTAYKANASRYVSEEEAK